ncbi:hypothetical protein [Chryseobacterium wanjuense]
MNRLNIAYIFIFFFLLSCKGQKENEQINIHKISIKGQIKNNNNNNNNNNKDKKSPINFLDKKYQKNGFSIPDDINGNLYPSYSYFDKSIGSFSVNYIGKNERIQYFWNVENEKGFFQNIQILKMEPMTLKVLRNQSMKMITIFLLHFYLQGI